MTKEVKIILIIAIIIIIAGLAVAFWPKQNQPSNTNQPVITEPDDNQQATTTEPEVITSDIDTSGWQTYRNEEHGFEVKYPKEWYIKEFNEYKTIFIDKFPFSDNPITPPPIFSVGVKDKSEYEDSTNYKEIKNIKINNYLAKKKVYYSDMLGADVYIITIETNGKIYIISSQIDDLIFAGLLNSFVGL